MRKTKQMKSVSHHPSVTNDIDIMSSCDVKFRHPFTCLIAGPTCSGKSNITFKIIKYREKIINGKINSVVYCLPPFQTIDVPEFIKNDINVEFRSGIPDFETLNENCLVVLDDLMSNASSDVMSLFTRQSHHTNVSVIFLVQNIFFGGNKFFRTISLNCHYIICMKNPRDRLQMSTLASQILPENSAFLKRAFANATEKPFGYLLFDLTQKCSDTLRFRTNIFPNDRPQNIFFIQGD